MISKRLRKIRRYCREPIENIENYDVAVKSDKKYNLHHRDEIRILPSGMLVLRRREELKENGRYYNCPANELIFLEEHEHKKLHAHKENHATWKGDNPTGKVMRARIRREKENATRLLKM